MHAARVLRMLLRLTALLRAPLGGGWQSRLRHQQSDPANVTAQLNSPRAYSSATDHRVMPIGDGAAGLQRSCRTIAYKYFDRH
jgi:hypothetical protein